jgi:hypothetical protein
MRQGDKTTFKFLKVRLQSFNIFLRFVSDKGFNYAIDETHNMFVFLIILKM